MSQPRRDVIDLTEDRSSPAEAQSFPPGYSIYEARIPAQRPPRFDREIISIDDQDDDVVGVRASSPEIQFLTSRPLSRSLSATRHVRHTRHPAARRQLVGIQAARPPVRRPQVALHITGAPTEAGGNQNPGWPFQPLATRVNTNHITRPHEEVLWDDVSVGDHFAMPAHLDYFAPAFNLEHPSRPQRQPRLPTYNPPPPAKEGFTRSPKEEDVLVCPNCDDELGLGDDEVKRQVWVVKACGHVCFGRLDIQTMLISCRSTVASVPRTDRSVKGPCCRQRHDVLAHFPNVS